MPTHIVTQFFRLPLPFLFLFLDSAPFVLFISACETVVYDFFVRFAAFAGLDEAAGGTCPSQMSADLPAFHVCTPVFSQQPIGTASCRDWLTLIILRPLKLQYY